MLKRPLLFAPYLKTVIWGGDKIKSYKHISTDIANVGESWEISAVPGHESVLIDHPVLNGKSLPQLIEQFGAELLGSDVMSRTGKSFPLLIKIIDAQRDLSVQVHPNDALALARHNCAGKTEMWYVIDNEDQAHIYTGLSAPLDPEEYTRRIADNSIMDVVASHLSQAGQFYFVPAGTLHAIGAGNLIAEIQQNSDITYRVYDYDRRDANGNPRELHTELAKDAIDYRFPNDITPTAVRYPHSTHGAVASEYFKTDYIDLNESAPYSIDNGGHTFAIVMVIDGEVDIEIGSNAFTYSQGTTILLPASMPKCILKGDAHLLITTC